MEWLNEPEVNESYEIWRNYGAPFGENEDQIGSIDDSGWEFVQGDIGPGAGNHGGEVVYAGTPKDILNFSKESVIFLSLAIA